MYTICALIPGDEDGLVVLPLGHSAQLHGVVSLDVQVHLPQRDLDLPDTVILAEGVLVIHLEHDGLLPDVIGGQLKIIKPVFINIMT